MTEQFVEVGSAKRAAYGRLKTVRSTGHWDSAPSPESKIHRIHAYPAKFPAFLAEKAFDYARNSGIQVKRVADVFCGCGTVAHETARQGLEFWGCDINPVATLIARAKSARYNPKRLETYTVRIIAAFAETTSETTLSPVAIERLQRWYSSTQFDDLARLRNAIERIVPARSRYREAFLCAFSAILKSTSQWRQRSTKPTLDPRKRPAGVLQAFRRQCTFMVSAWAETHLPAAQRREILRANVIDVPAPQELVDMIVTSPPYVTSYEYADLHQLSSLWLGYASDYRDLRKGSIGSSQHMLDFKHAFRDLNAVAMQVVFSLFDLDPSAARSIANYYLDMQCVALRCHEFLSIRGIAVFVIGNTEYNGIKIDNAAHLAESLFVAGFKRVRATKRVISNKLHTPYRLADGRFSQSKTEKRVYSEEFILIAHR